MLGQDQELPPTDRGVIGLHKRQVSCKWKLSEASQGVVVDFSPIIQVDSLQG